MTTTYTVTVTIDVHDEAALIKAAREHFVENRSGSIEEAEETIHSVEDALREFVDPGVSPDGTEIQDSDCEACI